MIRFWAALLLMLVAACASEVPPPPPPPPPPPAPPPPPPPPVVLPPPVMAVEMVGAVSAASPRPRRLVTRSTLRAGAAAPAQASIAASESTALPAVNAAAAAAGVEAGVAQFAKPPPMNVGAFTVIKFYAGPSEAAIGAQAGRTELTEATAIYVGKAMRVTLLPNPAFEIKPKSKAEQTTGLDRTAVWLWDVKPLNGQGKSLEAEVEIFALKADGGFGEQLESYTRQVEVEVRVNKMDEALNAIDRASTLGDKLAGLFGSWQKAIAGLIALIGAIGLLAWKLGLRRAKPVE